MSTIRIKQDCNEFGRAFTTGQLVGDLSEGQASAMVISQLATFQRSGTNVLALAKPIAVPITSVMRANPTAEMLTLRGTIFDDWTGLWRVNAVGTALESLVGAAPSGVIKTPDG